MTTENKIKYFENREDWRKWLTNNEDKTVWKNYQLFPDPYKRILVHGEGKQLIFV